MNKSIILLILILVFIGLSATGEGPTPDTEKSRKDVFLKIKMHTDPYYTSGRAIPADDYIKQVWLHNDKLAVISTWKKIIVDKVKQIMYICNLKNKTYVEAKLPLILDNFLAENIIQYFSTRKLKGKWEVTGKNKKIGRWSCRTYNASLWAGSKDSPSFAVDAQYFYTNEVPFNITKFRELYLFVSRLENYRFQDTTFESMNALAGIQVGINSTVYTDSVNITTTEQLLEVSHKKADPSIYSLPDNYKKLDKLSYQDLINH